MATKVRKQIYIEKRQDRFLKHQAKVQGVSEAEVVRRLLDGAHPSALRGGHDPSAIESFLRAARRRRATAGEGKPWKWNRDEIYEERLARYDKRSSGR
ncbi:MAG: hypothetical protein ACE149_05420 [Armatimonadota bacterium]